MDGAKLFRCQCEVATEQSGRAMVWDPVDRRWRLAIWPPSNGGNVQVNSFIPKADRPLICPVCGQVADHAKTLPAANIPLLVMQHLAAIHQDGPGVVALDSPRFNVAGIPAPTEV